MGNNEIELGDQVSFEWDFGVPNTMTAHVEGDLVDIGTGQTCYVKVNKSDSKEFRKGKVYAIPDEIIKRKNE